MVTQETAAKTNKSTDKYGDIMKERIERESGAENEQGNLRLLKQLQPPKGMRDLSGKDAEKLNRILQICRENFGKYGFEPLETPALESFDILAAKGAGESMK